MNSWCEKTKSPALVFPKPEPKRPTARNATAVTGGGAKAQAYEAQRTTLTAQGGGSGQAVPAPNDSGQAVPAPNDFSDRDCGDRLTITRRADAASAFPTTVRRPFVLLPLSVASSAGLCLTVDAATHSSVRLHLPIERSRRVTGLSLADSATRHDRNGPASFPPASRRRRSQRGCVIHPTDFSLPARASASRATIAARVAAIGISPSAKGPRAEAPGRRRVNRFASSPRPHAPANPARFGYPSRFQANASRRNAAGCAA